ncbi:hypothetical protein [Chlorobium phaeobacteroides]|jgi:hypothetical protein|uniref:STAS/SEC14 domain-containing protein n=1 Tax=Chlorobium phaeobacteroides (strain DSM 266 / SMG 266 / 2430) TaxID=290317 RepID=A1BHM0_CHLPD|nr:hypothetical protein [Chlorobium phaeobacteroides]ABL65897.1 hypothetical protein Cpha266_1881 [Chlorobium phaeobacteroides DSM 266]MBV5329264.1 hypothetical protein [Chlorobium sp.]
MPWRVFVHPDVPFIETVYAGVLTGTELSAAIRETISFAGMHRRNRFLADCQALEGGHSFSDLFFLADLVLSCDPEHLLKEAVLANDTPTVSRHALFWETTCLNRGLKVRLFTDRQSAIDWLAG